MKVCKSPLRILRVLTLSIISPVTGLSEADYFSPRDSDCLSKYNLLIFEPFEFRSYKLKCDLRFVWKAQRSCVHTAVRRGQKRRRRGLPALHRHIPVAASGHRGRWAQTHSHTPHPKTACLPALKAWTCVLSRRASERRDRRRQRRHVPRRHDGGSHRSARLPAKGSQSVSLNLALRCSS